MQGTALHRRRADVVGIFPNDDAIIRLVGARMPEINDEGAAARRSVTLEGLPGILHTDAVRRPAAAA